MTEGEHADLRALMAKWREKGAICDTYHATMGLGFKACADELESVLASLIEGRPNWQPIETAPKDGTSMLLYFVDGGTVICWWEDDAWTDADYHWIDSQFSHWMPLPDPPVVEPRTDPAANEYPDYNRVIHDREAMEAQIKRTAGGEMTGIERIAAERERQLLQWTRDHDRQVHDDETLHDAALTLLGYDAGPPWARDLARKHYEDRVNRLTIAGALIAAELDRITLPADPQTAPAAPEQER